MASLNDTRKQLDEIEKKVRSLTIALGQLKSVSGGDAELLAYFTRTEIEMNALIEKANTLKSSISGVGAGGGSNINAITEQVNKLTSAFDRNVESIKRMASASGDSNIIVPSTFKADATVTAAEREKQAYQDSFKAARQSVNQTLNIIKSFADGVNNTVNKIVNIIRTGIRLVNGIISGIVKTVTTLGHGVKSIISIFGNLGNRVRGGSNDFGIFSRSATELRSKIQLLKGALNTLFNNQMINQAKKFMSSVLSLSVLVGTDLTENTLNWAKSMQDAFGVDARGLISDMGEIAGVLKGLGMDAEDVANGSANLAIMSRYLGAMGMAGGDVDVVMSKITSGMKGMTQAIDDLGLSVREAEMNSFLKELKSGELKLKGMEDINLSNIGTSFAKLNEEARVYIRYASLITQFLENFGKFDTITGDYIFDVDSFNKVLNSVTGRLNILKQTWGGLLTTIGAGFAKIGALIAGFLIPIINAITTKVTELFAWLSKITGINFNVDINSNVNSLEFDTDDTSKSVKDTTDNISDLNDELKDVEENAKKAKGSLQSFDRVNNVTSSSNSNKANGDDNFDYSSLVSGVNKLLDPLNTAYDNFLANLNEKNTEYLKKFKKKINQWFKDITDRANFDLGFDWSLIKKNLEEIWKNIKHTIKTWGTFFIRIGLKIADDVNIGKIITKITTLINKATKLASVFSDILIPVLDEFYEEYLKPVFEWLGNKAIEYIDKAINKIEEWTNYIKDNPEEAAKNLKETLVNLWDVFNNNKKPEGFIENIVALFKSLKDVAVALEPIIVELAKSFANFVKDELLPWLIDKLETLANWLTENKDTLIEFFKKIGNIAWDAFKIFVDLLGKLIDIIVKHPNEAIAFFVGLTALKVGSWAISTAAGIGQLVFGLTNFAKLFGSGGALAGVGTKLSGLMSSAGGVLSSAGSAVTGGLGTVGTALGSTATTSAGLAVAGGASIAGIVGGIAGVGSGIKDLYDASKETNKEIKEQKQWSGGTKIGMVGAGAAAGAAIGSIVPGVGTAVGAAVGAGISGVAAIFKGSDISEWLHAAWDNTLKPFFTKTIPEALGKLVKRLKNLFTEIIPTAVSNIGNDIKTFFTETAPKFFGNLIDGVVKFFTEDLPLALGYIASSIKVFFTETVPKFFSGLWKDIKTFLTETIPTALETIKGKAITFFTVTIPKLFSSLWNSIKEFFTEIIPVVIETIKNKATRFFTVTIPKFFSSLWNSIKTFFTEIIPTAISNVKQGIKTLFTVTIPNKIKDLFGGIGNLFGGAVDWIKNKFSSIGKNFSSGFDAVVNKTSAKSAKSVTTHAVGGSIAGGQLFIANENGGAELVGNITGASGAQVANNGMIIEAMTSGVFEGVYNALAEINNQRVGNNMGGENTTIKLDGFGLIDSSTLGELARMLAPYLSSNNKNIADINFSI